MVDTATADEIHAAYKRLARRVHPDAGGDQRRMAAVNEAYRVLSDRGRRSAYDASRRSPVGPGATAAGFMGHAVRTTADDRDDDVDFVPMAPWQRRLPMWSLLVLGSLAAVFLFTAYAGSGRGSGPTTTLPAVDGTLEVLSCVREVSGGVVEEVPCAGRRDGVVKALIRVGERCPPYTRGLRRADGIDGYACVD